MEILIRQKNTTQLVRQQLAVTKPMHQNKINTARRNIIGTT